VSDKDPVFRDKGVKWILAVAIGLPLVGALVAIVMAVAKSL
jgi:hypothetical protein